MDQLFALGHVHAWKNILKLMRYEIILATLRDGQSVNPHAA
jgi:hypothetical protein